MTPETPYDFSLTLGELDAGVFLAKLSTAVRDLGARRSAMEQVEVRSDKGLPSGWLFRCTPYQGFAEQSIACRLRVVVAADKPLLSYRVMAADVLRQSLAEEFQGLLQTAMAKTAEVHLGTWSPGY